MANRQLVAAILALVLAGVGTVGVRLPKRTVSIIGFENSGYHFSLFNGSLSRFIFRLSNKSLFELTFGTECHSIRF